MSADVLRRAAAVLRERATAATPPPWRESPVNGNRYSALVADLPHPERPNVSAGGWDWDDNYGGCLVGESLMSHDRAYIATVHPGVGLALADFLDWAADDVNPGDDTEPAGLDIARAILGEAS